MTEPTRPAFFDLFGRTPAVRADAPGRVNLIGEHTDYNGGLVMPIATPQRTSAELSARPDGRARAYSLNVSDGQPILEYIVGREAPRRSWIDYVQGVTAVLADAGHRLGGFDLRIASTVPLGSGLSSSAALEIALIRGLRHLFALSLDDVTMARLAQQAENDFVGAPVGILDQMAAVLADEHTALYLDTFTLGYEHVPLPQRAGLAVVNSGIRHDHASGEYRTRRAECADACHRLGVTSLRELPNDSLAWHDLPAPLDRRVRHVLSENARVDAARDAMRADDLRSLGRILTASHASMRDDYEVSTPEIDALVESALSLRDVYGARLTGGGFGGCILALTTEDAAAGVADAIAQGGAGGSLQDVTVVIPPRATN